MPPNNPSYTPGPYRFIDREYMIISYRTDGDALQRFVPKPDGFDRQAASAFDHPRTEVRLTLRRREMDSNFQYAGAVNLVVGPFGWVVLCDRVRVRARRFWTTRYQRRGWVMLAAGVGAARRTARSMKAASPGWPARWPQIDGIGRNSAFCMQATSRRLSSTVK